MSEYWDLYTDNGTLIDRYDNVGAAVGALKKLDYSRHHLRYVKPKRYVVKEIKVDELEPKFTGWSGEGFATIEEAHESMIERVKGLTQLHTGRDFRTAYTYAIREV